jgi:hypothetical protein
MRWSPKDAAVSRSRSHASRRSSERPSVSADSVVVQQSCAVPSSIHSLQWWHWRPAICEIVARLVGALMHKACIGSAAARDVAGVAASWIAGALPIHAIELSRLRVCGDWFSTCRIFTVGVGSVCRPNPTSGASHWSAIAVMESASNALWDDAVA